MPKPTQLLPVQAFASEHVVGQSADLSVTECGLDNPPIKKGSEGFAALPVAWQFQSVKGCKA